jgi:hypothetical protein
MLLEFGKMKKWGIKQIGRALIFQPPKLICLTWKICTFYFWNILVLLVSDCNKLFLFLNVAKLIIWNTLFFFSFTTLFLITSICDDWFVVVMWCSLLSNWLYIDVGQENKICVFSWGLSLDVSKLGCLLVFF